MIVFAEFVVHTDACNDGVGGILSQEKTELNNSVAFASKSCCPIAKLFDHREGVFGIYTGNCIVVAILDIFL